MRELSMAFAPNAHDADEPITDECAENDTQLLGIEARTDVRKRVPALLFVAGRECGRTFLQTLQAHRLVCSGIGGAQHSDERRWHELYAEP
jgi:hypothetical protein